MDRPFRILVISPTPTDPITAGNRARIRKLVEAFTSWGGSVHFVHVQVEPGDDGAMRKRFGENFHPVSYVKPARRETMLGRWGRWARQLIDEQLRYANAIDDWYVPAVDDQVTLLKRAYRFDIVLVEYVFLSKVLDLFGPETTKIIDTHDVLSNRYRIFVERGEQPRWFSTTPKEEGRGLDRADVVLAIQEQEREALAKETRSRVVTVGHLATVEDRFRSRAGDEPPRMLFVGSRNRLNVEAVRGFLDATLPRIQERLPAATLLLAGGVCDYVADHPGCIKLGRFDDPGPVYEQGHVVVNPVTGGTGLNIKSVEAMGFGIPLVATEAGSRGMEEQRGHAFLAVSESQDFADAVVRVLTDRDLADRLSSAGMEFVREMNQRATTELRSLIDGSRGG